MRCLVSRARQVWGGITKHMGWLEQVLFFLMWIAIFAIVVAFTAVFASEVNVAAQNPVSAKEAVQLTEFPDIHLAMVEVRLCKAIQQTPNSPVSCWICDDSDHDWEGATIPPWKSSDFALHKLLGYASLTTSSYFYIHSHFVRPSPRSIVSATRLAYLGNRSYEDGQRCGCGDGICVGNSYLQVRAHNVPFALAFDEHGAQYRQGAIECMDYIDYRDGSKVPTTGTSGAFGQCSRSRSADGFVLNTMNWSTCAKTPGVQGVPVCRDSFDQQNRFQSAPSWPRSVFMLPVESSQSSRVFAQVIDSIESWRQKANASAITTNNNDFVYVTANKGDLATQLQNDFSHGAWFSSMPDQPGQLRQISFTTSSCAGVRCPLQGGHDLTVTITSVRGWDAAEFEIDIENADGGNGGIRNRTVFRADLNEAVIRRSIVFNWRIAVPLLASYFTTGLSVIGVIFPTTISVGYYYQRGFWAAKQEEQEESQQEAVSSDTSLSSHRV